MTDQNNSRDDILNLFTAENILGGSPFLKFVFELRDKLSRDSDGELIDWDTAMLRIQDEVKNLPTLELQTDVPAGTESVYQRQLLHALEEINATHDRVARKLIKIKSRLMAAVTVMKNQQSQFVAYFALGFPVAIHTANVPNMKMTPKGIEAIAAGEYSRVMDNLDNAAVSMLCELKLLEAEIKLSKVSAAEAYALGKDQVGLLWNSPQSNGAIGLDDEPSLLLKAPVEGDDGEIPSFVSLHSKEVRFGASIKRPQEIKGTFVKHGDPQPVTFIDDDGEIRPVVGGSLPPDEVAFDYEQPEAVQPSRPIKMPKLDVAGLDYDIPSEPTESVIVEADVDWVEITPDAEGLAAIGEIARKMNEETRAEAEEAHQAKAEADRQKTAALLNTTWSFSDFADQLLKPTKSIIIEDVQDSPPHSMQEATKLMEEASLGELKTANFKPITGKVLTSKLVEDIEGFLNDPDPLANPAPTNPRKRLMLLDEDEL
jgi:hypothetical protein